MSSTQDNMKMELEELYSDIILELSDVTPKLDTLKALARHLGIDESEIETASKRTLTENIRNELNNKIVAENAESSLTFLRDFYKKIFVSCTPEHSSGSSGATPGYRQNNQGLQFNELSDKLVELKFQLSDRDSPKEMRSEDNSPS